MGRLTRYTDIGEPLPDWDIRHNGYKSCLQKLAEYEDLEEQGKLIKLPCKVGDTVYDLVLCDDGIYRIFKMIVCNIVPYGEFSHKNGNVWNVYLENEYSKAYRRFYDFGKTVFLTKEEAEAALKLIMKDNEL